MEKSRGFIEANLSFWPRNALGYSPLRLGVFVFGYQLDFLVFAKFIFLASFIIHFGSEVAFVSVKVIFWDAQS